MLRRKIFLRTSILISLMIISILLVFTFFMIKNHRLGVKNRNLSFGILVAGEVERFIQWNDRLATDNILNNVIETNSNYEYLFVVQNGVIFADTFSNNIPHELIAYKAEYPDKAYYWEFEDHSGTTYCDFVIPMHISGSVLRMGIKLSSIDRHLKPAMIIITIIGCIALFIGISLSFWVAASSTREIFMLSNVIRKYNISNNSNNGKAATKQKRGIIVPELIESFEKLAEIRRLAEENLKHSLKEKDNLLSEIFHRTRNNMQIISSLLYLQADKYSDSKVDKIVEETNNRIHAMSLVHQMLHEANSIISIDINDLAISVSSFLLQKHENSSKQISFIDEISNIALSFDTAIPVSLILNELISNSLYHAFTEKDNGQINLKINEPENNRVSIIYTDNGKGLPADLNIDGDIAFLGLRLVKSIVENQLGGNIQIENDNGFHCLIDFSNHNDIARI